MNRTKSKVFLYFPLISSATDIDIKAFVKKPETKVDDDDDDNDSVVTTAMVDITFETAATSIKCEKAPHLRIPHPESGFSTPRLKSRYSITSHHITSHTLVTPFLYTLLCIVSYQSPHVKESVLITSHQFQSTGQDRCIALERRSMTECKSRNHCVIKMVTTLISLVLLLL